MIEVTPLTARTGAVISGLDLREPLDDETFALLHDSLMAHCVLFFRGQDLSDEQHLAFAGRWGQVNTSPYGGGSLEHLEDGRDSRPSADLWHTDMAFLPEPPDVAVLSMRAAPMSGGDTLWANLYELHDALSPAMQEIVAGLRQVLRRARPVGDGDGPTTYAPDPSAPSQEHPLVRVHPVTGRRALYLCGAFVCGFADMHQSESDALLALLRSGLHDPSLQVRWHWEDGDLAVWDERSTNHRALGDHWPRRRLVRRCTVGASPVIGPAG